MHENINQSERYGDAGKREKISASGLLYVRLWTMAILRTDLAASKNCERSQQHGPPPLKTKFAMRRAAMRANTVQQDKDRNVHEFA